MVLKFFNSSKEGLTLHGFKEFMYKMLDNSYKDLNDTLKNLGYNGDLVNERSQVFNLSVHSKPLEGDEPVKVFVRDSIETNLDQLSTYLILEERGETVLKSGTNYSIICHHSPASNSWSYAIKNHSNE